LAYPFSSSGWLAVMSFAKCRRGATAIEYGLIAGMVSIVMATALFVAGESTAGLYDSIATQLVTAFSSI
jgi:pilus assembly protein Flp/PilA